MVLQQESKRGAKIRLNLLSTSYEAFKEKGLHDPETTTSFSVVVVHISSSNIL